MKQVDADSQGKVRMGVGTLSGSIRRVVEADPICESAKRIEPETGGDAARKCQHAPSTLLEHVLLYGAQGNQCLALTFGTPCRPANLHAFIGSIRTHHPFATSQTRKDWSSLNGMAEIAGRIGLSDIMIRFLKLTDDPRIVVANPGARNFGAVLNDESLTPGANARIGSRNFAAWFSTRKPKMQMVKT